MKRRKIALSFLFAPQRILKEMIFHVLFDCKYRQAQKTNNNYIIRNWLVWHIVQVLLGKLKMQYNICDVA